MLIDVLLWILVVGLVIVGVAGLLLPALPGAPLVFAGLLIGAWIDDFAYVSWGTLITLGIMAALTYAVDFAAGALGASRFGASPRAVWGAVIGGIVGIFMGLVGIIIGPFVGAVIGELSAQRSLEEAGRAGLGATLGLVIGTAIKLTLAMAMVGIFVLMRFLGRRRAPYQADVYFCACTTMARICIWLPRRRATASATAAWIASASPPRCSIS